MAADAGIPRCRFSVANGPAWLRFSFGIVRAFMKTAVQGQGIWMLVRVLRAYAVWLAMVLTDYSGRQRTGNVPVYGTDLYLKSAQPLSKPEVLYAVETLLG